MCAYERSKIYVYVAIYFLNWFQIEIPNKVWINPILFSSYNHLFCCCCRCCCHVSYKYVQHFYLFERNKEKRGLQLLYFFVAVVVVYCMVSVQEMENSIHIFTENAINFFFLFCFLWQIFQICQTCFINAFANLILLKI